MPPTFDPTGSEATGITAPDGSEVQEVRDPDGNVVFSAGPAIPDSVVDNFEGGIYEDQSKTLGDYYGGDLADATRQQTTVNNGLYALQLENAGHIASTTGLPNYPSDGDVATVRFYTSANDIFRIGFCVQNANATWNESAYYALLDFRTNEPDLKIRGFASGNSIVSLNGSANVDPLNEWVKLEIDQTGTGFSVELFDSSGSSIDALSSSDTTYTSGGIGFAAFSTAYFDDYQII